MKMMLATVGMILGFGMSVHAQTLECGKGEIKIAPVQLISSFDCKSQGYYLSMDAKKFCLDPSPALKFMVRLAAENPERVDLAGKHVVTLPQACVTLRHKNSMWNGESASAVLSSFFEEGVTVQGY